MTHRGAGAPGAGLPYLGSEDQERIMKTLGLAILVVLAVGCGEQPNAESMEPITACTPVPIGSYVVTWTKTSGDCSQPTAADAVTVDVSAPSDLCGVLAQRSWPSSLCNGQPTTVICTPHPETCSISAVYDCPGICVGEYTVTLSQ